MNDIPLTNRIHTEIKRLSFQQQISPDFLASMTVDERVEGEFATDLAIRVILNLVGGVVATTEHPPAEIDRHVHTSGYTRFPKTWWNGFKFELFKSSWFGWMFPDYALSDWVEYETIEHVKNDITQLKQVIQHWHLCPLPIGAASHSSYLSFLLWDKPFVGSQREYTLLRNIAQEALLCCNREASNSLLCLLQQYLRESELLSARSSYY